MADLSLRYMLYGEDKTASSSIKGVGAQAHSTAGMVGAGISKLGTAVGGEVGAMLDRVSMGFDQIGNSSKGMGPKLAVGGAAVAGLGLAFTTMASGDVEAMNQLNAAVDATGKGYSGFADDVEKLIQKQVQFGNTDDQVTTALRVLTQAYGDPKKALAEMAVTTDLAAAKHISLSAAAGLVAKVHGGAGKVLKEFGLSLSTTTTLTKGLAAAQKAHTVALDNLEKAQKSLADLEIKDHAKKKLTIADQQALAAAHDKVKVAQGNVKSTTEALTKATEANAKGVTAGDEALTKLSVKLKGQASASMDSFGGKVKEVQTWLTNQASTIGQKYGPALTMAGTVVTALGTVMQILAARHAAAAVATDAGTAAAARQTLGAKIAAAAQWLWNAALSANPIGLVIAAIALLVGAIVLIATKTTWFQTIWEYTSGAIGAAWKALWNGVLQPVIQFILGGFAALATMIGKVLVALGNIPGFGWAKTAGEFMLNAAAGARSLATGINQIQDKHVTIGVTWDVPSMPIASVSGSMRKTLAGHNAMGTDNWGGGLTWVGEQGPELMSLPRGTAIHSNANSMSMAGSGGGGDAVFNMSVALDGKVFFHAMRRASIDEARRNGSSGLKL